VVDPAAFGDADHFEVMAAETVPAAKDVPPAKGFAEILAPGEPERRMMEWRSRESIAVVEAACKDVKRAAERFSPALPESKIVAREPCIAILNFTRK
jgi:LDH2 family malate/lactate/ureidoglycolate dehydrogenase